jgi:UBA-like domain
MAGQERNYPMLESCRVQLLPETGIDKPPVRLPPDCLQMETLPKPYTFALGALSYCSLRSSSAQRRGVAKLCACRVVCPLLRMFLSPPMLRTKEREVLKKLESREMEWGLTKASSREELQANLLARMKSVTNASEDVCISLLKSNSYDLGDSIEAYLSR